jgi:xylulokinase
MAHLADRPPGTDDAPLFICLDIGLTHVKAVLFDAGGALVDRESVGYRTHRPTADYVEQDPADWWVSLRRAISALRSRDPASVRRVAAVGVTAHMHGLVCQDAAGQAIGPAIVLGDRRATAEAAKITEDLGAAWIWRTTGALLDPSIPAAELSWLRRHDPERFRAADLFTSVKDHLRGRLTGDRLTEPIDACATSLYDIHARGWSSELLAEVGVEHRRLPNVVAPEVAAGPLRADAARDLGLPSGTPVIVGAGDDVEVLGGGLLEPGDALEHLGTTGSILAVAREPIVDPALALELYPHVVPDRWVVGGSITTAGAALGRVAELLGYAGIAAMLDSLDGPAPRPGDDGLVFLASLAGERCPERDPAARGAWIGITSATRREDLARAALEGVAFSLRRILDAIERLLGPQHRILLSSGGADLDPRWLEVRAATYGRTLVRLATPEPTSLGLLAVVTAGAGVYPDVATASRAIARTAGEISAHHGTRTALAERYTKTVAAAAALRPAWPASG